MHGVSTHLRSSVILSFLLLLPLLLHNRTHSEQIPTTGASRGRGHHADIHGIPVSQVMAVFVLCRLCLYWRSHLSVGAVDAPATDCLDCGPLRNEQRRGDCYRGKYAIYPCPIVCSPTYYPPYFLFLFFASPVTRSMKIVTHVSRYG